MGRSYDITLRLRLHNLERKPKTHRPVARVQNEKSAKKNKEQKKGKKS